MATKRKKKAALTRVTEEIRPAAQAEAPDPDEFSEEWMDEQDVRRGRAWVRFGGSCAREFCDVRTKDGKEVGPCWPKGDVFVKLEDDEEVLCGAVTHVRFYEDRSVPRDRDEEECEDEA